MRKRVAIGIALGALILCGVLYAWPEFGTVRNIPQPVKRDLDQIKADTLRVLVVERPLTYERVGEMEVGLEFELLKRFAHRLGVPIKAVEVDHPDSLLPRLQRGDGDVIAARLSKPNNISRRIAHSSPYRYANPVFAGLRSDRILGIGSRINDADGPDTAWVMAWSSFAPSERLHPGGERVTKQRTLFTDTSSHTTSVIINAALGRIGAALVSEAEAAYYARWFPQLAFNRMESDPVPLVFGMRRNAPTLWRAMDNWLSDPEEKEAQAMLMSSYGSRLPSRGALGHARMVEMDGDALSPYDSLFQALGNAGAWDWELLAAIAFKESRFDPLAVSNRGAKGLMQMMPRTARSLGEDSMHLVPSQINAAARYLASLDTIWMRSIPQPSQRLRFILAAYNAGPGHVKDAQRLAAKLGLDPVKWEGHVERAITLLALPEYFQLPEVEGGRCIGAQTFIYVREVIGLYEQFRLFAVDGKSIRSAMPVVIDPPEEKVVSEPEG